MNKKKLIYLGVILGVVILVLVGFLLMPKKNTQTEAERESTLPQEQTVKKVPSSVKVALEKTPDGKKVNLVIDNIPSGTTDIEYELSYDTSSGVPRGVLGTITVDGPSYEKEVVLGSCSTKVCTYDEGVEKIKVLLKFNSAEGASVFEKEFAV
jgi:hypothetical protein